ncbi:class I SAM-dependent methyltransferase [Geomonas sp. RF6]|uniref:class I SAM-dependent methyltransferase n=1 Tax=Geomonas sp. RF6 TaxID=2897342 RepID=UPI001E4FC7FA|nr:class I SAM-dependent methyltransferase [Geomonas sp. RF6]UFS69901.1 class I SAM-dependent methyltransferase [Geomonas sp. RF6]
MEETDLTRLETVTRFFSGTGFSYDQVVNICTAGFDRYWKKVILEQIPPSPTRIIDQACGTGILTFAIARRFPQCTVTGVELREEYLSLAREKAQREGIKNVKFLLGRAEEVIVPGEQDCITSSYLAKYADLGELAKNARRMLRPGGVMVLHDFTYPANRAVLPFWHGCFTLMRSFGGRYFPEWRTVFEELPGFLRDTRWLPKTLEALESHDFCEIKTRSLTFGSAALVTARKPPATQHQKDL